MNVGQMIKELQKMGFKVDARRRTDGGWIITKINDMTFSGASGNQYARQVLGVELSQARIEQVHFNVTKYIKGSKKPKDSLDEELVKKLRKVQRVWRKQKVNARITKSKLRWHLSQEGRAAAEKYLERMTRYGKGFAYEENVMYLAKYIEDSAKVVGDNQLKNTTLNIANEVRARAATFKEAWISEIYSWWYEVNESAQQTGIADNNIVAQAIYKTVTKIR